MQLIGDHRAFRAL